MKRDIRHGRDGVAFSWLAFMNEKVYPTLTSCYKDHANEINLVYFFWEGHKLLEQVLEFGFCA